MAAARAQMRHDSCNDTSDRAHPRAASGPRQLRGAAHEGGSESMSNGVARRVEAIVAEQLGLRPEEVSSDVSLRDDLAADSLDMLALTAAIEDDLGLTVPERLLEDVRTVGELVSATLELARAR